MTTNILSTPLACGSRKCRKWLNNGTITLEEASKLKLSAVVRHLTNLLLSSPLNFLVEIAVAAQRTLLFFNNSKSFLPT